MPAGNPTDESSDQTEAVEQNRDLPERDKKAEETGDRQAEQERGIFSPLVGNGQSLGDPSAD